MNQLLTYLKAGLLYSYSGLKNFTTYIFLITYGFLILPIVVFAEGSNEIYVGADNQGLLICNDYSSHCVNSDGDTRTHFAAYNCGSLDRLTASHCQQAALYGEYPQYLKMASIGRERIMAMETLNLMER